MNLKKLEGIVSIVDGRVRIDNVDSLRKMMDELISDAVFAEDEETKKRLLTLIKEIAKEAGAVPASIQGLYGKL